jgi:PKD repeat protein
MFKRLIKLTATLLILFLLPMASVQASGKMEVKLGEKITLQGAGVEPGSVYKWVIKKGKEILSTQTTPILNYTFVQQGEYDVNLTLTNAAGDVRATTVSILAGDRYPRPTIEGGEIVPEEMPLYVSYSTLPPMQEDGAVHLIGDGKVLFIIDVVRDDVLEYRIDRNIFEDSDGNGVANDDIDNANDNSYLLGGLWETEYKVGEATKIVAEITLVTKDGEKTKSQAGIVFGQADTEGDPVAVLETSPVADVGDQLIHLYEDSSTVGFYSRASKGKILEYRIDKNIFVDSDGDGNPANDIDNKNDPSFTTGDVWKTEYNKTDDQIIAQLIVVGEGGKGSRVQRGIWFTDKPKPPSIAESKDVIRVEADKPFVLKGDPIDFKIVGLTQTLDNYIFAWDFDGNGEADMEIEADNTVSYIYDFAGVYDLAVMITDKSENTATFNMEVVVKDVTTTTADFDFEIEGNTVKFTNTSIPSLKLSNQNLNYTWSFGDTDPLGYQEQKDQIGATDPTYTYNKAGTYIVSLTAVDAEDVVDTKTSEVIITADLPPEEAIGGIPEEPETFIPATEKEGSSLIVKILKLILYLILIVIVLAIVIIVGFLVFLKLQNPDLTFEELIEELKIKILGMLGVGEMVQPIEPSAVSDQPSAEELIEGEVTEPEESITEEVEAAKEPPLAKETGPVPEWMKPSEPSAVSNQPSDEEPFEEPAEEEPPMPTTEEVPIETEEPKTEEPAEESVPGTEIKEGEEVEIPEEDKPSKNKPPKKGGGAPSISDQSGPVPDWLKGA